MFKVSEDTFLEVKELITEGMADSKIRYDLGLLQPTLNTIRKYENFSDYETHFPDAGGSVEDEEDGKPEEPEPTRAVQPSKPVKEYEKGYFRGTIAKTDDPYKEMRDALGVSIRGLWKIIGLLEQRKLGLERQIREMEAYLMKGAAVIENEIEQ